MMARHVVAYENSGRQELSKFAFNLARKLEKELNMGEVVYKEMKKMFLLAKEDHYKFVKSIPSENIRHYLLFTAMENRDTKVIKAEWVFTQVKIHYSRRMYHVNVDISVVVFTR